MTFEMDSKRALRNTGDWAMSALGMVLVAIPDMDPEYPEHTLLEMEEIAKKLEDGARSLRGKIAAIRHDLSKIEDVATKNWGFEAATIKNYRLGDATATVGIRENRTMWIGVQSNNGSHFQCDFDGDFIDGPKSLKDFRTDPPSWVHKLFLGAK